MGIGPYQHMPIWHRSLFESARSFAVRSAQPHPELADNPAMTWRILGMGWGVLELGQGVELVVWWGDGTTRAAWFSPSTGGLVAWSAIGLA